MKKVVLISAQPFAFMTFICGILDLAIGICLIQLWIIKQSSFSIGLLLLWIPVV